MKFQTSLLVRVIKIACIIFLFIFVSSCSSIEAKKDGFGHMYEGTTTAVKNTKCATELFWPLALYTSIDVIVSFFVDTVFLPIDIFATTDSERNNGRPMSGNDGCK